MDMAVGTSSGPASPVVLTRTPALTPLLLRGALRSPFRRPSPDAAHPTARLALPGLRIDLARLCNYERVCGFATGEDALPVTYPHVLGFPLAMRLMSGPGFPLPLLGLVHTSIEITHHAPLPAHGRYELAVHIAGLAPHRRGTEAVVRTELRTDGEAAAGAGTAVVVWESTSTYLARHRARTAPDSAARTQAHPQTPDPQSRQAPDPLPAVAEWHLADDIGRRYGTVSGDRNPIHLHPLTARLFGFPRAIAHGMWTVARCLAAHGTPQTTAARVRAAFRAPVPLPGTVIYGADRTDPTDRERTDGTGRFELRDATGERVHLTGELTRLNPSG
ncbi:MaoC family dehydratase [Streptomyces sp. YIM S03343]